MLHYDIRFGAPGAGAGMESRNDLVLRGGGVTLAYGDHSPQMGGWPHRAVPLTEAAGWQKGSGSMRMPANGRTSASCSERSPTWRSGAGAASDPALTYLDSVGVSPPRGAGTR